MDNQIPSHFEPNSWIIIISWTDSEQVVFHRIMDSSDPEVFVDQISNLPAAEGNSPAFGLFVPPDWFFF